MSKHKTHDTKQGSYRPLLSLIAIAALAACALAWHTGEGATAWMHYFMGLFLCSFAMLKIFDLSGFADGFQMYDLIAKRLRVYAYAYPFVELGLGLGFLSFYRPEAVYVLTAAVMAISAAGVMLALKKGLNIHCPCMGSVLKVPLSTVTLTEDITMGLMAIAMFFMH